MVNDATQRNHRMQAKQSNQATYRITTGLPLIYPICPVLHLPLKVWRSTLGKMDKMGQLIPLLGNNLAEGGL
ncbi:putative proteasome subunit alpha type-2 [Fusarium oxysporum f. sp. albedinis]|nr:putative proteasome subunit alpha type-2 [Fusarium oxysporum f. sp. albedinis]